MKKFDLWVYLGEIHFNWIGRAENKDPTVFKCNWFCACGFVCRGRINSVYDFLNVYSLDLLHSPLLCAASGKIHVKKTSWLFLFIRLSFLHILKKYKVCLGSIIIDLFCRHVLRGIRLRQFQDPSSSSGNACDLNLGMLDFLNAVLIYY